MRILVNNKGFSATKHLLARYDTIGTMRAIFQKLGTRFLF